MNSCAEFPSLVLKRKATNEKNLCAVSRVLQNINIKNGKCLFSANVGKLLPKYLSILFY
jgi:hypothetical protein